MMEKWQNFFLQKMGEDAYGVSYPVCESVSSFGIYCKTIPFKLFEKVKEPAKRSYYDEHGDDEYIGAGGLRLEAYTIKVEFGCKKQPTVNTAGTVAVADVRQKVGTFLEYLRESGMLKLYSSYTRVGRQYVRLESVPDNAKWKSEGDDEWLIFEVVFKVNDPVTDVVL